MWKIVEVYAKKVIAIRQTNKGKKGGWDHLKGVGGGSEYQSVGVKKPE